MGQRQNQKLLEAPYVYVKAEATIAVATVYDPTESPGSTVDADGIGRKLKDMFVLADADCTIEFWDYVSSAYRTAEKIKGGIAAIFENESIGLHKITPTGASATIEIHRGSALP